MRSQDRALHSSASRVKKELQSLRPSQHTILRGVTNTALTQSLMCCLRLLLRCTSRRVSLIESNPARAGGRLKETVKSPYSE